MRKLYQLLFKTNKNISFDQGKAMVRPAKRHNQHQKNLLYFRLLLSALTGMWSTFCMECPGYEESNGYSTGYS